MIIVIIATSKIKFSNGPLEIIEKTHLQKFKILEVCIKNSFLNKKNNYGYWRYFN